MKVITPVALLALPELAPDIFNQLARAGARHSAIFGGAPRDADYAARHQVDKPVRDYDVRIWIEPTDHEFHKQLVLDRLRIVFGPMVPMPGLGNGPMRYIFNYKGSELDVSIRPIPEHFRYRQIPVGAVAYDRAQDSDIGLSSVALDPTLQAWGSLQYLADRDNKTLTVYPIDNPERKAAYLAKMQKKFPEHRAIEL